MAGQNYILLAIGLFVSLIVTVAAVDQYLLTQHPTSEVEGLLWRVESAFSRIEDLEALLVIDEDASAGESVRMLVRLVNGPPPVMSVKYLEPAPLAGQLTTVQNDLLSHFLPLDNLVVVRRWVGIPLAAIGLAGLDLTQLQTDWEAGKVDIRLLENAAAVPLDVFASPILTGSTLSEADCTDGLSFCQLVEPPAFSELGFSQIAEALGESFQTGYVLEVRTTATGSLARMVWVDRESYLIQKVVFYTDDGRRDRTIRVERMTLNQGLTADEVLALPRNAEIVRG